MLGPVQNEMQYEKVKSFFEDSKKQGYTFAHGQQDVEKTPGFFVNPTIIDNPPATSKIWSEEPFGMFPEIPKTTVSRLLCRQLAMRWQPYSVAHD